MDYKREGDFLEDYYNDPVVQYGWYQQDLTAISITVKRMRKNSEKVVNTVRHVGAPKKIINRIWITKILKTISFLPKRKG